MVRTILILSKFCFVVDEKEIEVESNTGPSKRNNQREREVLCHDSLMDVSSAKYAGMHVVAEAVGGYWVVPKTDFRTARFDLITFLISDGLINNIMLSGAVEKFSDHLI